MALVSNSGELATASSNNKDSTDPFAMMQGRVSCFTGSQSPIHTILPIHYLIENGYYSPNQENVEIIEQYAAILEINHLFFHLQVPLWEKQMRLAAYRRM